MRVIYSINNLRSLKDVSPVELRPITILVGRNSVGKSTFLRSLPLIRQSLEGRANAPILWYGSLVDFGDFEAAVHNRNTDNIITFSFDAKNIEIRDDEYSVYRIHNPAIFNTRRRRNIISNAKIEVDIGFILSRTIRKAVRLSVPSQSVSAYLEVGRDGKVCDNIVINGISIKEVLPEYQLIFGSNGLLSAPSLTKEARDGDIRVREVVSIHSVIAEAIEKIIAPMVDKRIGDERVRSEAFRIIGIPKIDQVTLEGISRRVDIRSFSKMYHRWSQNLDEPNFVRVAWLNSLYQTISLYSSVGRAISDVFKSTSYIGPARASGERFYRYQELEVSEIASNGDNLPMFLASLIPSELARFSEWVDKIFGFGVVVERSTGHISINLKRGNIKANVADTGYGISQILPVLAQAWWMTQRSQRRTSAYMSANSIRLVAMEQPELHLHPAHQARLADVFVEATKGAKSPTHFIIETHSESLINRIGELIEEGAIAADDVQVVIFSGDEVGGPTTTSISTFRPDGILEHWPFGFFSY